MSHYLPYLLAGICLGFPTLIFAWFAWDCWKASQEHRDERDL